MRAAGIVLVVLGSLWSAVGAVLVVVSLLWANPDSLPDWVDAAASDPAALGRLAVVGAIGVGTGIAQLASGLAVQRPSIGWAPRVGLGAALFGGLVTGAWLVSGLAQGLPGTIFLPVVAAYGYAAWALAFQRGT
jgi:hypothetical protein